MKKVRASFPDTRLAVLYHPNLMLEKSLEELKQDFKQIYAEAAPVDLALVDIDTNIPDERVREVVEIIHGIEERCSKPQIKEDKT